MEISRTSISALLAVSRSAMESQHLQLQSAMNERLGYDSSDIDVDLMEDKRPNSASDQISSDNDHLSTPNAAIESRSNDADVDADDAGDGEHKKLPEYLDRLLQGSGVCGDSRVAFQKPPWYDEEKFKLGQKLSVDYSFGVVYAHMISLIMIFTFKSGLEPLIYSGKSGTPVKAFKRYLSTVLRVKSWSETDIWQEGSDGNNNMKIVRAMHEHIRRSMTEALPEEVAQKVSGDGKPRWVALHKEISQDFKSSCPVASYPLDGQDHVYVNQTDMAITQFGFVGLILLFPKMFGIHRASDADFEGYAHFWRTISYLLGVEDKYNVCDGDLETVKQRCRDIVRLWVMPRLHEASLDWMHMSRCMCEGVGYYMEVGTSFELVLFYLCQVLGVATPKLRSALSFGQMFMFYVTWFLYFYALRLVGVLNFLNFILKLVIQKGQDISNTPDAMRKLEGRVYQFNTN